MSLKQVALSNIDKKAPYMFSDKNVAFKKDGELRQSKELKKTIRKHASNAAHCGGASVYALRVDSFQCGCKAITYNTFTGKIEAEL